MAGNLRPMATGMIIDGVFASEAIDSSGEVLDVEGCDISTLDKDGVLNYEHKEGDKKDPRGGNNGEEIVGKIVYAKKIFKASDCETDRQREYWNKVGHLPFIYGICRLYDGAGHSGAQALAAQIRDHHANNEPILVRFSIEGSTLERKGNRLLASVARRVAATLKPCNRTAISGLVEDPKAPSGFDKNPVDQEKPVKDILAGLFDDHRDSEDAKKREHEHPMYTKLGGEFEVECSPLIKDEVDLQRAIKLIMKAKMVKALTAGSYAGAPSGLTGGAALQREHLAGWKNRAMAALRDYGNKKFDKAEFKAILKAKLPEADDSFIDHFANIVDDYKVKLKKGEEDQLAAPAVEAPKPKKPKTKAAAPAPAPIQAPKKTVALKGPKIPKEALQQPPSTTKKTKPKQNETEQGVGNVSWDAKTGTLITPHGSYKANYDPTAWDGILSNPEFQDKFDSVVNNWKIVHGLRKQGIMIPGETAIAAMMGGYSGNEKVPVQELAIQYTLDAMKQHGYNPEEGPMPPEMEADLRQRFNSGQWPESNKEWFQGHPDVIVPKAALAEQRAKGTPIENESLRRVGKPEDKIGTLNFYHRLHPFLHDLMKKHGMNGQKIAEELIKAKENFESWKNQQRVKFDKPLADWERKRKKELKGEGLTDDKIKQIVSEERTKEREKLGTWGSLDDKLAYAGPVIEHLSNKTLRYMVGMLGYGDMHVPDTHFTRHYFGMNPTARDPESRKAVENIKAALLDPANAHILNQIDEHYRKNHPVVKWVQKRYFNGRDDVHSVFPGFWAHWLNIAPHERATGRRPAEQDEEANESSTHAPYWWAVAQQMKKHGIPGWDKMIFKGEHPMAHLPMQVRIAQALREIHESHGPVGAQIAYFLMVPALMDSQGKDHAKMIRKMESLTIELRKASADIAAGAMHEDEPTDPEEGVTYFAGRQVIPGLARTADGEYRLLHEDRTHYIAAPVGCKDRLNEMVKFPKAKAGTHYIVMRRPTTFVSDLEN